MKILPYHAYGGQQDNSTVRDRDAQRSGAITEREWYDVGGGESGWIAPDPTQTNVVFAGSYGGLRHPFRSTSTGKSRNVNRLAR